MRPEFVLWRRLPANGVARGGRARGAVLVAALVCLAVVMLSQGTLVRSLVHRNRQQDREAWRQQAALLAEAALRRAEARLRGDAAYRGETWRPADDKRAAVGVAVVTARPVAEQEGVFEVRVEAAFPDDPLQRALHVVEAVVRRAADKSRP